MQEEKILDKWNYITYNFSDYIFKIYLNNFNDLYVHVGGCAPKCGCLKRPAGLGHPNLESQAVVGHLMWTLGVELGPPARTVLSLNHCAICHQPIIIF